MSSDVKSRYWAAICYPDSMGDVPQLVANAHVTCFLSPLHSPVSGHDGSERKPHYHLLAVSSGPMRQSVVMHWFPWIPSYLWQRVNDFRAYARYLCHLDNPDKEQLSPEQVQSFGGLDYFSVIELPGDQLDLLREMQTWCRHNQVFYYSQLVDYAAAARPDWFRALMTRQRENMYRYLVSLYACYCANPPDVPDEVPPDLQ